MITFISFFTNPTFWMEWRTNLDESCIWYVFLCPQRMTLDFKFTGQRKGCIGWMIPQWMLSFTSEEKRDTWRMIPIKNNISTIVLLVPLQLRILFSSRFSCAYSYEWNFRWKINFLFSPPATAHISKGDLNLFKARSWLLVHFHYSCFYRYVLRLLTIPYWPTWSLSDRLTEKPFISPHNNQINRSNPRHIAHHWKAENISFLKKCYLSGLVGLVERQLWQKWETHLYVALFSSSTDIICQFLQKNQPSMLAHFLFKKKY